MADESRWAEERGRYGGQGRYRRGAYDYGARPGRYGSEGRDWGDYGARGYGEAAYPGGRYMGEGYGRGYGGDYLSPAERYGYGYGLNDRYGYGARHLHDHPGDERGWWDRASDEVSSWFGDEEAERRRRMDEMRAGDHRGRGPKGYTRSDDRIREDVSDQLTDHPWIDASDIEVKVGAGEVTLSGLVASRADKRRAEDCAERVSGVKHVQNDLRVRERPSDVAAEEVATSGRTTLV